MTTKTLKRSGTLLIISGILLALGMVFHPDMSRPDYAASSAWVTVHIVLGFSTLLGLAGLVGLFTVMNPKLTAFGKAAFGLAVLGNLLLTGLMFFVEASVLPVLARDPAYQPLLSPSGPLMTGALGTSIWISMLIAAVGFLCLAAYLAATKTISTGNGILFIGVLPLVFSPPLPLSIGIIGALLLGGAITWLGVSIQRGIAHQSLASSVRMQDECFAQLGHA